MAVVGADTPSSWEASSVEGENAVISFLLSASRQRVALLMVF